MIPNIKNEAATFQRKEDIHDGSEDTTWKADQEKERSSFARELSTRGPSQRRQGAIRGVKRVTHPRYHGKKVGRTFKGNQKQDVSGGVKSVIAQGEKETGSSR